MDKTFWTYSTLYAHPKLLRWIRDEVQHGLRTGWSSFGSDPWEKPDLGVLAGSISDLILKSGSGLFPKSGCDQNTRIRNQLWETLFPGRRRKGGYRRNSWREDSQEAGACEAHPLHHGRLRVQRYQQGMEGSRAIDSFKSSRINTDPTE